MTGWTVSATLPPSATSDDRDSLFDALADAAHRWEQTHPGLDVDLTGHPADDFYEDDEPIEDVLAAYNAGPHQVTAAPVPWLVNPRQDTYTSAVNIHRSM